MGPEGSVLCFVVIVLLWIAFDRVVSEYTVEFRTGASRNKFMIRRGFHFGSRNVKSIGPPK